jgi:hypothetical protein
LDCDDGDLGRDFASCLKPLMEKLDWVAKNNVNVIYNLNIGLFCHVSNTREYDVKLDWDTYRNWTNRLFILKKSILTC